MLLVAIAGFCGYLGRNSGEGLKLGRNPGKIV
jgi:hypothetical protein